MYNWVTMLYSRELTEHCKPAMMEKNKNHFKKEKKKKISSADGTVVGVWLLERDLGLNLTFFSDHSVTMVKRNTSLRALL